MQIGLCNLNFFFSDYEILELQIFVLPEAFVKLGLICLVCGLIGCCVSSCFFNLTGDDLMVYLNQVNIYKILIPRHNMDFAHILHIFFLRINPQEVVCASVERKEVKMEEGMRERKERRELVRK